MALFPHGVPSCFMAVHLMASSPGDALASAMLLRALIPFSASDWPHSDCRTLRPAAGGCATAQAQNPRSGAVALAAYRRLSGAAGFPRRLSFFRLPRVAEDRLR